MDVLVVSGSPEASVGTLLEAAKSAGHRVRVARDPEAAEQECRAKRPDVLVVDWMTLGSRAVDLVRKVRQRGGDEHCVVLAVVDADPTELDEALDIGVSDYVSRPMTHEACIARLAIVERWCCLAREQRQGKEEEQRRVLQRLSETEEDFWTVLSQSLDPVGIHRDRIFLYANPALVLALGYDDASELVGKPIADVIHPEEQEIVEQRLRETESSGRAVPSREMRFLRKDGTMRIAEGHSFPIRLADGPALISLGRDITETRRLEARLRHAQQLASVGASAASVAHEINNPMTLVLCNLADLCDELPGLANRVSPEVIRELEARVETVREGVEQMRVLASDLTRFAREQEPVPSLVDLRAIVERVLRMARPRLRNGIELSMELESVPMVRGIETRLVQLVLNLLLNAVDALHQAPEEPPRRLRVTTRGAGNEAILEVEDNGPGVPPDLREKIFDPFFTTKAANGGTGLGLAVAQSIVEEAGGTLELESEPDVSTVFRVRLAAARAD